MDMSPNSSFSRDMVDKMTAAAFLPNTSLAVSSSSFLNTKDFSSPAQKPIVHTKKKYVAPVGSSSSKDTTKSKASLKDRLLGWFGPKQTEPSSQPEQSQTVRETLSSSPSNGTEESSSIRSSYLESFVMNKTVTQSISASPSGYLDIMFSLLETTDLEEQKQGKRYVASLAATNKLNKNGYLDAMTLLQVRNRRKPVSTDIKESEANLSSSPSSPSSSSSISDTTLGDTTTNMDASLSDALNENSPGTGSYSAYMDALKKSKAVTQGQQTQPLVEDASHSDALTKNSPGTGSYSAYKDAFIKSKAATQGQNQEMVPQSPTSAVDKVQQSPGITSQYATTVAPTTQVSSVISPSPVAETPKAAPPPSSSTEVIIPPPAPRLSKASPKNRAQPEPQVEANPNLRNIYNILGIKPSEERYNSDLHTPPPPNYEKK